MISSSLDLKNNKKKFYVFFLIIFSFFINQYYGNLGLNPLDSFFSFNSGFDILNGFFPFKDYWTITGPFISFFQAFLFSLFGVSWFTYVLQASLFNIVFTITTFFILNKFKLNINYCFLYSLFLSILAYPSAGTPYVDHQSSYFSIIAIYCFILAVKDKSKLYWFLLPIILGFSFLIKQAPTGHITIIIITLSLVYFLFNFDFKKILYGIYGSIFIISLFFLILYVCKIPLSSFYQQYILFPISLGENRLDFIFPLEFKRLFLRYKLIHLSLVIIFISLIINIFKNHKYIFSNEALINLSLITSTFALIVHQLMTLNGIFIFFMIPILAGFSHIYYLKYYADKKLILYFLIILSTSSTIYYWHKYINKRDFMDLSNVNLNKSIDAKIIDKKLGGLKWITVLHPNNPSEEINNLKAVINIFKNDPKNKMIVTDYQFISVIISQYDMSPNQVWFEYHVHPMKGQKYYKEYRNFFIDKIKENQVQIIYTVKPMWGGENHLEEVLDSDCIKETKKSPILDSHLILECDDLK